MFRTVLATLLLVVFLAGPALSIELRSGSAANISKQGTTKLAANALTLARVAVQ